jgi:hypothetical protein
MDRTQTNKTLEYGMSIHLPYHYTCNTYILVSNRMNRVSVGAGPSSTLPAPCSLETALWGFRCHHITENTLSSCDMLRGVAYSIVVADVVELTAVCVKNKNLKAEVNLTSKRPFPVATNVDLESYPQTIRNVHVMSCVIDRTILFIDGLPSYNNVSSNHNDRTKSNAFDDHAMNHVDQQQHDDDDDDDERNKPGEVVDGLRRAYRTLPTIVALYCIC